MHARGRPLDLASSGGRCSARLGFGKERWLALDPIARRAVKTVFWVAVGLILSRSAASGTRPRSSRPRSCFALVVIPWRAAAARPVDRARLVFLVLAVLYPFYYTHLFGSPIFGPAPGMDTMVVMMIFTMMALGLNIVVGYAGLLDLGYVAFYAIGAYMSGWFASSQFAAHKIHFGAVGITPDAPGFHFSIWLILSPPGSSTAFVGVLIGLPTLRLRGDYLAIVTLGFGEIIPQIARNGDNFFGTGFNLTGGTQGLTPIDGPGFGNWLHDHVGLPANYLDLQTAGFYPLLLDGAAPRAVHGVLLDPPARLAARPRVDRDPRGRDRRRRDGRAADAHEDVGVRDGRVLRRRRRRVLRELQVGDVPRRLLLQHLRVHPLHGHPRRDRQHPRRHLRRVLPRLPEPRRAREHRRLAERHFGPAALRSRSGTSLSTCRCTSSGSSA